MKKITATALLLLLLAPLAVFADPPSGGIGVNGGVNQSNVTAGSITPPPSVFDGGTPAPDLSAPPPVNGSAVTSLQDNVANQSASATAADLAANINQCGDPSTGAALQQAISNIGPRLGRAALQGIANGLSSYGVLGNAAGRILTGSSIGDVSRGLVGNLGGYAGNTVSQQISGACGDSSLGRQICGTVGNAVGNYVNGAIQQYGGQILNQIGLGGAGSLFGGVTSSIPGLSGVAAIFGSGNPISALTGVAVNDAGTQSAIGNSNTILTNTQHLTSTINDNAGRLVYSTCTAGPTAAALRVQAVRGQTATAVQNAAAQQDQNPTASVSRAGDINVQWYLNDPNSGLTPQQRAEGVAAMSAGMPDCNNPPQNDDPRMQLWQSASFSEYCSDTALQSRLAQVRAQGQDAYRQLVSTQTGPRPTGTCDAGPYAGTTNHPELCPAGHYVIALTSGTQAGVLNSAIGHQFDLSEAAIGAAADRLGAQLIDEIFTSVANSAESGLQRLVSNRSNGGSRNGSFVDQLTGNVGPSEAQSAQYLTSNITDALSIEAQYQDSTQAILDALTGTQTVFMNIQACYASLVTNPVSGISVDDAKTATENASTTVNIILGKQVQARKQNIDYSISAVNDLGVLVDQLQAASTAAQINKIADTYDAMVAAGRIHTTDELQLLADDVNQLVPALSLAQQDAQTQLTQCQAYRTPTPSTGG